MSEKKTNAPELTVIDGEGTDAGHESANKPLFRVVKGNPTEEELGALTAVLSTLNAEAEEEAAKDRHQPINNWGSFSEWLDRPQTFNPNAFRNCRFF
ncbi:acyl-CoA carboxylase subunit epsilon [Corynebacterium pyruviciproducens]|uniref:acyl-CoA carboxylase subunit epsilon n=1 Tax=Corynebacterium pyruviciproducens TaxID=598660 RepID=UPI00255189FA|nr:acyl-CoA carboxylase subunit epsilon [Corynebacterium pyruviciproducens]MDK6565425.1 acyl-CoA carboxylase subunit epsilon [Corynebacterium pyruviciproducens]